MVHQKCHYTTVEKNGTPKILLYNGGGFKRNWYSKKFHYYHSGKKERNGTPEISPYHCSNNKNGTPEILVYCCQKKKKKTEKEEIINLSSKRRSHNTRQLCNINNDDDDKTQPQQHGTVSAISTQTCPANRLPSKLYNQPKTDRYKSINLHIT